MSERQPHIDLPEAKETLFDMKRNQGIEKTGFTENKTDIMATQRIRPDPFRPGEFIIEDEDEPELEGIIPPPNKFEYIFFAVLGVSLNALTIYVGYLLITLIEWPLIGTVLILYGILGALQSMARG